MKPNYLIIGALLFLIYSCTDNKLKSNRIVVVSDTTFTNKLYKRMDNTERGNLDSIQQVISKGNKTLEGTLKYIFSIEDVGTEGNEGTAYYTNNKLQKIEFDIYTSMWKIHLQYIFNRNDVQVTEATFNIFENLKLVKKLSYRINLDGVPLVKVDSSRVDVFKEIKDAVPFTLK